MALKNCSKHGYRNPNRSKAAAAYAPRESFRNRRQGRRGLVGEFAAENTLAHDLQ